MFSVYDLLFSYWGVKECDRREDDVIDEAVERGDQSVLLEVFEHNTPAINLYEGLGFEPLRRLVHLGEGDDAHLGRHEQRPRPTGPVEDDAERAGLGERLTLRLVVGL